MLAITHCMHASNNNYYISLLHTRLCIAEDDIGARIHWEVYAKD